MIYAHNLTFDLVSFFYDRYELLAARKDSRFSFECAGWTIAGVYGGPNYVEFKDRSNKRSALLLDSSSWFMTSLANAALEVCPETPKLDTPADLTQDIRTDADLERILPYAMRDAEIACRLGETVDDWHRAADLPQTLTAAGMSADLFRRRYLDHPIYRQQHGWEYGVYAYHGGKNYYAGQGPAWYHDHAGVDIKSAYPYAMTQLPAFSNPKAYRPQQLFRPGCTQFPPWGSYLIDGYAERDGPPALFDHAFKPIRGPFENVWVNGLELNNALRHRRARLTGSVLGYYYDQDKEQPSTTAFQRFVTDQYARKEDPTTSPTMRKFHKLAMNGLYGKTIQTNANSDIDDRGAETLTWSPGGMFHPLIAGCITAITRGICLDVELYAGAVHTSTDGLIVPSRNTGPYPFVPASGIGSIEVEFDHASVAILRNKAYAAFADRDANPRKPPSRQFPGYSVVKFATHGMTGCTLEKFERLVATGERFYRATRPNKLRDSINRGLLPNQFVEHDVNVRVPALSGTPPQRALRAHPDPLDPAQARI